MRDPEATTRSVLSGRASDVVQARDIEGGVHFHQSEGGLNGPPRQLLADVRGFVNRVVELDRLNEILNEEAEDPHAARVVVITGTAGVGKTSLAVHWAHQVRERFTDGQLYINLRGYDPGAPVAPEAALDLFVQALGVRASAIPADLHAKAALFRSLVADRNVLVVLDNAATDTQIRPLLPGTASCLVLVTSRSRMPGLVARNGATRLTVDVLTDAEAVRLLQAVTAESRRQKDDPAELNELAHLCAFLPLALRIAAERAASRQWMPLTELIQDLRDESALWSALSSSDDDDADGVRSVFAWSYRALPTDAAQVFRRLGLHPGAEFSLAAAAALAGLTLRQTRHLLDGLLANHLLEQIGPDRYQLHDLLRAYAIDQARHEESVDEQQAITHRMVGWYLHTADAARRSIVRGSRQLPIDLPPVPGLDLVAFSTYTHAMDWYETERANLIEATHAAAAAGLDELAWRLPAVLCGIYDNCDPANTWLSAEQAALDAALRAENTYGQAVITERLGVKYRKLRRIDEALACFADAAALFDREGNEFGKDRVVNGIGLTYLRNGRFEEARAAFEQGLSVVSAESPSRAILQLNLGEVYLKLGRLPEAISSLTEILPTLRDADDLAAESVTLRLRGAAERAAGLLTKARSSLQQALELTRTRSNPIFECELFLEFARLELAEGAPDKALISAHRATVMSQQLYVTEVEAAALDVTGTAYQQLDRADDAAPFHRRAVDLYRELGDDEGMSVALDHLATSSEDEE